MLLLSQLISFDFPEEYFSSFFGDEYDMYEAWDAATNRARAERTDVNFIVLWFTRYWIEYVVKVKFMMLESDS